MKFMFFFLFTFFAGEAIGQGRVTFNESPEITAMMSRFMAKNKENKTIRGWRVQIVSTDDRREMDQARGQFNSMYPGRPISWKHVSPYYQVRVGAYRTKTEMMPFLLELKKSFPTATPVQDDIDKFDLINF